MSVDVKETVQNEEKKEETIETKPKSKYIKNYKLYKRCLNKSVEAFKLAIEIFNKPTVNYRSEGFCFFICNAWDLMLKAKIIRDRDIKDIYRKNGDTKSVGELLNLVIPSQTDYTRRNLELVYELRNQATHFILKDFDIVYAPIFQACVINYVNKFTDYFDRSPIKESDSNYIVLVSNIKQIDEAKIMNKHNKKSAELLINALKEIKENKGNDKMVLDLNVDIRLRLEKSKNKADINFAYEKDANVSNTIAEKEVDKRLRYPYTYTTLFEELTKRFSSKIPSLTSATLKKYCEVNKIYDNDIYFFDMKDGSYKSKKYSASFLDALTIQLQSNINLFENYKK